jgi:hypothetical protein
VHHETLAGKAQMLSTIRPRLTYANVVATLALLVALGGTSLAAVRIGSREIRNNSVRSVDIHNNGVRGADIRDGDITGGDIRDRSMTGSELSDGSLTGRHVRGGSLTGTELRDRSLTGADVGERSLEGANLARESIGSDEVGGLLAGDFAPGQLPDPMPSTLPPGRTLRGAFATSVTGGSGDSSISRAPISFPIPLASAPIDHAYVSVGQSPPSQCPGSATNPRAAPGAFCAYEAGLTGVAVLRGFFDPVTGENFRSSRFGAVAFVNGEAGTGIRGTWAVTAP